MSTAAIDAGQVSVSSNVTISLFSPSGTLPTRYLNCTLGKNSIYGGSGIQYQVYRDVNNVITSITPSGNTVSSANILSTIGSVTWNGTSTVASISYIFDSGSEQSIGVNTASVTSGSIGDHILSIAATIIKQTPGTMQSPSSVFTSPSSVVTSINTDLNSKLSTRFGESSFINNLLLVSDILPGTSTTVAYLNPSMIQSTVIKCMFDSQIVYTLHGVSRTITLKNIPLAINIVT